jgi:signal transduction histidine kinase
MSQPPPVVPSPSGADAERRLRRAERLLAYYRPVLGHDLPNLLVAILGLLQILELEEGAHLGPEGQDYLRRLRDSTHRAQATVRLLKDIGRAAEDPGPAEGVPLADLVDEVTALVKLLYPERSIEYDLSIQVPVVVLPRRLLHRALTQLLRHVVDRLPGAQSHLQIGSRTMPEGIEVWVADGAGEPPAGTTVRPGGDGTCETRLGLALVAELADAWGGTFRPTFVPGQGNTYTFLIRP